MQSNIKHMYIYIIILHIFRVMKGIRRAGESETLVAVKMLKSDVLITVAMTICIYSISCKGLANRLLI